MHIEKKNGTALRLSYFILSCCLDIAEAEDQLFHFYRLIVVEKYSEWGRFLYEATNTTIYYPVNGHEELQSPTLL